MGKRETCFAPGIFGVGASRCASCIFSIVKCFKTLSTTFLGEHMSEMVSKTYTSDDAIHIAMSIISKSPHPCNLISQLTGVISKTYTLHHDKHSVCVLFQNCRSHVWRPFKDLPVWSQFIVNALGKRWRPISTRDVVHQELTLYRLPYCNAYHSTIKKGYSWNALHLCSTWELKHSPLLWPFLR